MSQRLPLQIIIFFVGVIYLVLVISFLAVYHDDNIQITESYLTNVTASSATIIFTTPKPTIGKIVYQKADQPWVPVISQFTSSSAFDDRTNDSQVHKQQLIQRYTHSITIKNLSPDTKYQIRVPGIFTGKSLSFLGFHTPKISEELVTPEPVYGLIEGIDYLDSIVILAPNDQVTSTGDLTTNSILSTTVATNGTYTLDLAPEKRQHMAIKILSGANSIPIYHFPNNNTRPFDRVTVNLNNLAIGQSATQSQLVSKLATQNSQTNNNLPQNLLHQIVGENLYSYPEFTPSTLEQAGDFTPTAGELATITSSPAAETQETNLELKDFAGNNNVSNDNDSEPIITPTPPEIPEFIETGRLPAGIEATPYCDELNLSHFTEQSPLSTTQNLISSISAQTNETQQPNISEGDMVITEEGRITFFEDGEQIAETDVVLDTNNREIKVRIYYDNNGNRQKDANEPYMDDYTRIRYASNDHAVRYHINAGWNLLNLPLLDTRPEESNRINTAKRLLQYWNSQGAELKHIARYKNNDFELVSIREAGRFYGNDFPLEPGQAIFLYNAKYSSYLTFSGNKYLDPVPLQLQNGWNLVGFISPNTDYTSNNLFAEMSAQNLQLATISKFENGIYHSVISDKNTIYGNSFDLNPQSGYFINILATETSEFIP